MGRYLRYEPVSDQKLKACYDYYRCASCGSQFYAPKYQKAFNERRSLCINCLSEHEADELEDMAWKVLWGADDE